MNKTKLRGCLRLVNEEKRALLLKYLRVKIRVLVAELQMRHPEILDMSEADIYAKLAGLAREHGHRAA